MNYTIKKATVEDLESILELSYLLCKYEYEKYHNENIYLDWPKSNEGRSFYIDLIENHFVYIVYHQKKVVAYACGKIYAKESWEKEGVAELINIYVLEQYRKQSIASHLIQKFYEYCRQRQVKHIQIFTLAENIEALKCYEKNLLKPKKIIMEYDI